MELKINNTIIECKGITTSDETPLVDDYSSLPTSKKRGDILIKGFRLTYIDKVGVNYIKRIFNGQSNVTFEITMPDDDDTVTTFQGFIDKYECDSLGIY